MALAAVGNRLLASGHPAPTEVDAPANAGLLVSTDSAGTWTATALAGEADFHALDGTADRTWGIDSASGQLLTSTDDRQWQVASNQPLLDIAVDPLSPDHVLGTTDQGVIVRIGRDGTMTPLTAAPQAKFLDSNPNGDLVAVDQSGELWLSVGAGDIWISQPGVPGEPTVLTLTDGGVYLATTDGLHRAPAVGQPFKRLFTIGHGA